MPKVAKTSVVSPRTDLVRARGGPGETAGSVSDHRTSPRSDFSSSNIVLLAMLAYEEFESRVLIPHIYGKALRLPSSVVFFSLMVGGTLMGILGALLALPVAATIMMLIEELRVDLPGEQEFVADTALRARDDLEEEEYERRTEGVGARQAAAIAVEISEDRRYEDQHPDPPT